MNPKRDTSHGTLAPLNKNMKNQSRKTQSKMKTKLRDTHLRTKAKRTTDPWVGREPKMRPLKVKPPGAVEKRTEEDKNLCLAVTSQHKKPSKGNVGRKRERNMKEKSKPSRPWATAVDLIHESTRIKGVRGCQERTTDPSAEDTRRLTVAQVSIFLSNFSYSALGLVSWDLAVTSHITFSLCLKFRFLMSKRYSARKRTKEQETNSALFHSLRTVPSWVFLCYRNLGM